MKSLSHRSMTTEIANIDIVLLLLFDLKSNENASRERTDTGRVTRREFFSVF